MADFLSDAAIDAIAKSSSVEDDPELLAELAGLGPAPEEPPRDAAALRAEALARKKDALRLKRAGDTKAAVLALREAKKLEEEAAAWKQTAARRPRRDPRRLRRDAHRADIPLTNRSTAAGCHVDIPWRTATPWDRDEFRTLW